MSKDSRLTQKRFFRISGVVLVIAALFGLAMNLAGYAPEKELSLFQKVPVPKQLEEVLGAAKDFLPLGEKEGSGEDSPPGSQSLSLAQVKEGAKDKVVSESKEVIREKVVEILKELVGKLTEEEGVQGKVCGQVCEEVCQEACE